MPLGTMVGLSPGDSVLDGDQAPSPQRGGASSPIFGPFLMWPDGWMHQDTTWCGGRPQPKGLYVSWGPSPLPKRRRSPQFSTHVYCGQTAEWIKMALGMEAGLGPGHFVLDGDPAPPPRGTAPNFRPMYVMAKPLDGSRCHLVRRYVSAQAILC